MYLAICSPAFRVIAESGQNDVLHFPPCSPKVVDLALCHVDRAVFRESSAVTCTASITRTVNYARRVCVVLWGVTEFRSELRYCEIGYGVYGRCEWDSLRSGTRIYPISRQRGHRGVKVGALRSKQVSCLL